MKRVRMVADGRASVYEYDEKNRKVLAHYMVSVPSDARDGITIEPIDDKKPA